MWKDSETNIDLLDFDYLIEITKDIILNDELSPSSIGIYGDWGSGKSSLMEMLIADISKDPTTLCLKFNGWLFEGYEDAKSALIGTILDKIEGNKTIEGRAKNVLKRLYKNIDFFKLASKGVKYGLDFLVTGGIGTIADLTLQTVLENAKDKAKDIKEEEIREVMSSTFSSSEIRHNLKLFQQDFAELLKETKIKKLVVFIDELDRCNPNTILETLEAIRLFLFTDGTSFIIGADERQIMYAVRTRFPEIKGNQIDIGKEYLEKMIQYPIKIPQLGVREAQFYIFCLLLKEALKDDYDEIINFIKEEKQKDFLNFEITYELLNTRFPSFDTQLKEVLSISKQLSTVLTHRLNGNPRHYKRFLNSLSMRIKMAEIKKISLDKRILAKIMILEYFKDSVYKEIGELQAQKKGKPEEIKMIEQNNWENVEKLKIWKDDDWFLKWVKMEPELGDTNLQPYYYFTRESLQTQSYSSSKSLSPAAEKVLNNLMSKSDSLRLEAIKNAKQISIYESTEILKSLISEIESQSQIDFKIFKSFIQWGETNLELFADVISCLSQIPANKIALSFIPLICDFGKTSKREASITELFKKWGKENPKLKTAIETELKS